MVFNSLDRLVDSMPILGPKVVEGVPFESILNKAKPVAIVESNLLASLLYILLTKFQVERKTLSNVSCFIPSKIQK